MSRYSIDRPVAFRRHSGPQILVALRSRAKLAVIVAMGSKSREVIYGGRIIGARIRAEGAQEAAQKAVREADRAAAELWSIQMEAYGGPARPSPTIAQCLNGGYTTQSSPQSRRSDSKAAPRRPVGSKRYDRRTRCHSARCHPGMRRAFHRHDIGRDLLG
jgi:hypothetical protein